MSTSLTTKYHVVITTYLLAILSGCTIYRSQGRTSFENKISSANSNLTLLGCEEGMRNPSVQAGLVGEGMGLTPEVQDKRAFGELRSESTSNNSQMKIIFGSESGEIWLMPLNHGRSLFIETIQFLKNSSQSCYFNLSDVMAWPTIKKQIVGFLASPEATN